MEIAGGVGAFPSFGVMTIYALSISDGKEAEDAAATNTQERVGQGWSEIVCFRHSISHQVPGIFQSGEIE